MASPTSENAVLEPPRKRQKLSPPPQSPSPPQPQPQSQPQPQLHPPSTTQPSQLPVTKMEVRVPVTDNGFQPGREAAVGIREFVNISNPGFSGTLKQRYTDFIVNEILPNGAVAHLTDDRAPRVTAEQAGLGSSQADAPTSHEELSKDEKENTVPKRIPPIKYSDYRLEAAAEETASGSKPKNPALQDAPAQTENAEAPAKVKNDSVADFVLSPEDEEVLVKYFGSAVKDQLMEFHQTIMSKPSAKSGHFGNIESEPVTDRSLRGKMHADVRRIFSSRIETAFVEESGKIKFTAGSPRARQAQGGKAQLAKPNPRDRQQNQHDPNQSRGKLGWDLVGGEHLHFSLYKENKDTMEVISFLARMLHVKPKDFSFAGTKDRRAVTVQRVSIYRQRANALANLNYQLFSGSRIGNFKHEKHRLELGELGGNEFHITLRDCHFGDDSDLDITARLQHANEVVGQAIMHLQNHGFINYFGLQRFGSFSTGTHEIGKLILQGKFKEAVEAILVFDEKLVGKNQEYASKVGRDDIARAHSINTFKSGNGDAALKSLPKKFSAETNLIRHLSRKNSNADYLGALQLINRNLKTMYVHAYQSLVWNIVASERWSKYGSKVIEGDLVLVDTQAVKAVGKDDVDENGEVVVHPGDDDSAVSRDDIYQRARALTAEEAGSGQYTIFDIVLPTPGFDIEYPSNDIGDFYKTYMSSEEGGGLDPADMRRKQKDFSLSGSYRKFLAQVGKDLSFEVKQYYNENEQLVETDLERLEKSRPKSQYITGKQTGQFESDARGDRGGRGGQGGRGGRGGRGARGGRFNDNRGGCQQQADSENSSETSPQLSPADRAARINAWKNLPEKLAAEDKAAAKAHELEKLNRNALEVVSTPAINDTWIETSAENEGRRTGFRSRITLGDDPVEDKIKEPEAKTNTTADVTEIAIEVDTKTVATPGVKHTGVALEVGNSNLSSSMTTVSDGSDGGVLLVDHTRLLTPKTTDVEMTNGKHELKRPADQMSTSSVEETRPPRIAVIVKFALGASQYATMALRELMKAGGVKDYKPAFSR